MNLNKSDLLGYCLLFFIVFIVLKVYYFDTEYYQLKCIVSTVDGEKYCVRDRSKLKDAADLLAAVTTKCKQLVDYVNQKYNEDNRTDEINQLVSNFNPQKVMETLPTSQHTAYSENKGEKIAFCLNTEKKGGDDLIDINTLTFVAIHELSHVMTKSIGHKEDFWQNFKFLLENAKEAGIYEPVDYKQRPKKYCGMKITDNPYYDL